MARGLVHLVASDAHDVKHRPPKLSGAYRELVGEWGETAIRPLFSDNPRSVLAGEPFDSFVKPLRQTRRWYQVWG